MTLLLVYKITYSVINLTQQRTYIAYSSRRIIALLRSCVTNRFYTAW